MIKKKEECNKIYKKKEIKDKRKTKPQFYDFKSESYELVQIT